MLSAAPLDPPAVRATPSAPASAPASPPSLATSETRDDPLTIVAHASTAGAALTVRDGLAVVDATAFAPRRTRQGTFAVVNVDDRPHAGVLVATAPVRLGPPRRAGPESIRLTVEELRGEGPRLIYFGDIPGLRIEELGMFRPDETRRYVFSLRVVASPTTPRATSAASSASVSFDWRASPS